MVSWLSVVVRAFYLTERFVSDFSLELCCVAETFFPSEAQC